MAIVKFKDSRFAGYSYDTAKGVVLSTKRSASPKPLAWLDKSGRKYVKLYTTSGLVETHDKHRIEKHLIGSTSQSKVLPMKVEVNTVKPTSLVPFKYAGFHAYKYDTVSRTVFSTKRSTTPLPLTWVSKGAELYVKLYDTEGRGTNLSRTEIEKYWINLDSVNSKQIQLESVHTPSTGICYQGTIEEADYVLYSAQNKWCWFFEKGTRLEDAIQQFQNDCVATVEPEDIRVLIPRTGETKRIIEVSTQTTYKLD